MREEGNGGGADVGVYVEVIGHMTPADARNSPVDSSFPPRWRTLD